MSDLPSALMAALGAIMIMMEISQAITGRQHRLHTDTLMDSFVIGREGNDSVS